MNHLEPENPGVATGKMLSRIPTPKLAYKVDPFIKPINTAMAAHRALSKRSVQFDAPKTYSQLKAYPFAYSFMTDALVAANGGEPPVGLSIAPGQTLELPIELDQDKAWHLLNLKYSVMEKRDIVINGVTYSQYLPWDKDQYFASLTPALFTPQPKYSEFNWDYIPGLASVSAGGSIVSVTDRVYDMNTIISSNSIYVAYATDGTKQFIQTGSSVGITTSTIALLNPVSKDISDSPFYKIGESDLSPVFNGWFKEYVLVSQNGYDSKVGDVMGIVFPNLGLVKFRIAAINVDFNPGADQIVGADFKLIDINANEIKLDGFPLDLQGTSINRSINKITNMHLPDAFTSLGYIPDTYYLTKYIKATLFHPSLNSQYSYGIAQRFPEETNNSGLSEKRVAIEALQGENSGLGMLRTPMQLPRDGITSIKLQNIHDTKTLIVNGSLFGYKIEGR